LIWEDLGRLTLEQRRVLLLQAQHDVIEVLQRAGIAGIQEIAALLELPPAAVEELRCARALSDARLAQRFGFRKATIMQQRHRARRRMMEWRKRWAT
jgi:DNA-directed RNA polymerase specialized sigma24 family protein